MSARDGDTCVWPFDDVSCRGGVEVRGLCHRHYMRAARTGVLHRFPEARYFGEIDTRRMGDRGHDAGPCKCKRPRPGPADECAGCHRVVLSAERIADLQERYVLLRGRMVRRP